MPTQAEVFDKVKEALIDALAVDDSEVTPDATIVGDLGAESIDFLDIVFRLETAFKIKIAREDLFPDDILSNSKYVQNGKMSDEGLALLKQRMPFADLSKFEANPVVQSFAGLLTVQDLCNFVEMKVNAA